MYNRTPLHSYCDYRDIERMNVMMDADALFPLGFHPITHGFLPEGHGVPAPVRSRVGNPVRYHYIDFGLSAYFPPGVQPRHVIGMFAREQEIPELSWDVPFDPLDRKSTRLNSSHSGESRMPSSA